MHICSLVFVAASSVVVEGLLLGPGATLRPAQPQLARQSRIRMAEAEEMTEEEYLAELAKEEGENAQELSPDAKKVYWNMRSVTGVEFAPWMNVDPEAIAKAEKERKARKERAALSAEDIDGLSLDPQAAELGAGGGLKSRNISEEEVELKWSTGNEEGNMGFIVQRRKGGSEIFTDLATFENFAPLKSKGIDGGSYTYLDDTVPSPGTWVYRIQDCDRTGKRSRVCQKLVEIDSQSEQTFTLAVGGVLALAALALVAAGISADPIQTTAAGRGGGFF